MGDIYYVDGRFVEAETACLPVTDLALLRGYGVFDFMRTYNGQPFHLKAHVERLFHSAQLIGMPLPWSQREVIDIITETIKRNQDHTDFNVRVLATGGSSPDNITPAGRPRLVVIVQPATVFPSEYYTDGIKVVTVRENRFMPLAKSINYMAAVMALQYAHDKAAVEAIYINSASHIMEGTTTNIFLFHGDTLITPGEGILPGVTRSVVIEMVRETFNVEERKTHINDLIDADEAFLTASNKQIMPVVQVDDTIIGTGKPGRRTRKIMTMFGELTGVALPTA